MDIDGLLLILKHSSVQAVWLTQNQMIVNPHKFWLLFYKALKTYNILNQLSFKLKRGKIEATITVKLLEITIDKLNFEEHI